MEWLKYWQIAKRIAAKMWKYQSIISLFLALTSVLLKFIPSNNEVLVTRPADEPTKFISDISLVFDNFRGGLVLRNVVINNSDMTMVFYYAPWSKESHDCAKEFEAAAKAMYGQVSFVAVNCWYIKGACRGKLQFQKFPQIFFHRRNMKSEILYTGPKKKDYILNFLRKAMFPLEYLSSEMEVRNFINRNQFTIIAAFNPEGLDVSKDFNRFAVIATKLLQYDDLPIECGIIVNSDIAKKNFMKPGILYLHNSMKKKEVIEIRLSSNIEKIVQRLAKLERDLVCKDYNTRWSHSAFLQACLQKGPLLAVFISSPSVSQRQIYAKKVRQLAIHFYDKDDASLGVTNGRIYARTNSKNLRCCKSYISEEMNPTLVCSVCQKSSYSETKPTTNYAPCDFKDSYFKNPNAIDRLRHEVQTSPNISHCVDVTLFYQSYGTQICCEDRASLYLNSMKSFQDIQKKKIHDLYEYKDNLLLKNNNFPDSTIFNEHVDPGDSIIRGLAHTGNKTLQFVMLNLNCHEKFAENFGIVEPHIYTKDGSNFGAAIFDEQEEKSHVLMSNSFNLEEFIFNYTLGLLPEYLQSSSVDSASIQTVPHPHIHEVTTDTFNQLVLNSTKNVLLLYYVPWCLSCTSISHHYLYLADILHGSPTTLVARINSDANKVPLPFRVERYPTIILYQANRSSYSTVFPYDSDINISNLLIFLLRNIEISLLKPTLLDICIRAKDYPSIQHAACQKFQSF